MKNIFAIIVLVVGIGLLVYGFISYDDSKTLLEIGDLEIKDGNKTPGNNALMMLIAGGILTVGGGFMMRKK